MHGIIQSFEIADDEEEVTSERTSGIGSTGN